MANTEIGSTKIAYTSEIMEQTATSLTRRMQIYTKAVGGGSATQVMNSNANDLDPVVSADGNYIAFLSDRENHSQGNVDSNGRSNGTYDLYVCTADGSSVYKIADLNLSRSRADSWDGENTYGSYSTSVQYSWSPDGDKLLYQWYDSSNYRYHVGLVSRSAGTNTILSSSASNIMRNITWSPDGTKYAYSISDAIYVANSDGTNNRAVLNNSNFSANQYNVGFAFKDNNTLFLAKSDNSSNSGLWTLALDGSVPQLYHQDIFSRYLDNNWTNVQKWLYNPSTNSIDYWLESSAVSSSGVRSYGINTGVTTTYDLNGLDGFSWSGSYVSGSSASSATGFALDTNTLPNTPILWGEGAVDLSVDLASLTSYIAGTSNNGIIGLVGGLGNDNLKGNANHNQIWGGNGGNDTLTSGTGGSIFWFGKNDGYDVISATNYNSASSIYFYNASLGACSFAQSGEDLLVNAGGSGTLNVKGWYSSANASTRIMHATFADGNSL